MTAVSAGARSAAAVSVRAVTVKAASLLLRYPDGEMLAALPAVRAALAELPASWAQPLSLVTEHRAGTDPIVLAAEYVELFDLRRRCCLHLSYYTAGDTRNRGEALVEFAAVYKGAGYAVPSDELPDYLPAVLDLAAYAGEPAWRLLRGHRIGLDLLAQALQAHGSVYRHVMEVVRALLPPATPSDLAAAAALARCGPPHEHVGLGEVGLQPFALTPAAPGGHR
jgi:nitrate reductase molybdenum cofactor assembly chaperone NarJ/NarW